MERGEHSSPASEDPPKERGGPCRFCVCVPARNEAERLPRLLAALAKQDVGGVIPVVVAVNNTSDASVSVIEECRRELKGRLAIQVDEIRFPGALAHAGSARARAMEVGLQCLRRRDDGVLLTTDADCRPPTTWLSENLRAIDAGADLVGGRLAIDDAEPLPAAESVVRALWDRYWQRVREIEDALDPRPWDPPPRHGDHTGASLALTVKIYLAAGGVPPLAAGEDCALVEAAVGVGGRLVHPPGVWTRVSPRLVGRAAGGMAQTMAELHDGVEAGRPPRAPSLALWRTRAAWRADLRRQADGVARIAREESRLAPMPCDMALTDILANAGQLRPESISHLPDSDGPVKAAPSIIDPACATEGGGQVAQEHRFS